ncbi:MAG TPA: hypothetical protein ENO30_02455 [Thermodesulfobium narugense]|nr:hypothetical protein [Thermodesulfobium narugense]
MMNSMGMNKVIKSNLRKLGIENNIMKFIANNINKGIDIHKLGNLFESSLNKNERKNKGQFYTPQNIVNYIISYLNIDSTKNIMDPACGCGSFLLSIADVIKKNEGIPKFDNLYGIDINSNAVEITKLSLTIKSGFNKELIKVLNSNIVVGNSIVENRNVDPLAVDWKKTFSNIIKNGGFDIIIGNPPYITLKKNDFDPKESIYQKIVKGPANAVILMIGKSLEYLKEGGILAFVLPKSVLHVNTYSRLREYILRNTSIIHILDLGIKFKDVRGEQVILMLKKEKPTPEHLIEIKVLKDPNISLENHKSFFIKQNTFHEFNNKILICDNYSCYSIVDKIKSTGEQLRNIEGIQIFRGLTLSSKILHKTMKEGDEKVIKGKSIAKFYIKDFNYVDIQHIEKLNKELLRKIRTKKIIMQNIYSSESGIIAAYDEEGLITLDTVTNIIVEDDLFARYLLGLLHSKLINFYISFALFNRGRLTMHLDQSYIGEIPIAKIENDNYYNIIDLVDRLINQKLELKHILKAIDNEVYKIYNIKNYEIDVVEMEMGKLLSKKSIW